MPDEYATDALKAHFHPSTVRERALTMQHKQAVWLDCLDRYVSGWDLSADEVKKDTPPGWSELHDQCPLVVELRRKNHEGTLCPGLPMVDKAPKRTIFLDLSNVKKNTYLFEIKNLLMDPTGNAQDGRFLHEGFGREKGTQVSWNEEERPG